VLARFRPVPLGRRRVPRQAAGQGTRRRRAGASQGQGQVKGRGQSSGENGAIPSGPEHKPREILGRPMELDDELCLCFHVTRRKVENYLRQTQPQRASQLSECFGAGTGCGWCRPFLRRLWQRAQQAADSAQGPACPAEPPAELGSPPTHTTDTPESATPPDQPPPLLDLNPEPTDPLPDAESYARLRAAYRKNQRP
jgi:bacterioferritin-associated ferredoxin